VDATAAAIRVLAEVLLVDEDACGLCGLKRGRKGRLCRRCSWVAGAPVVVDGQRTWDWCTASRHRRIAVHRDAEGRWLCGECLRKGRGKGPTMSYADAARDYLAAGWAPLPLPAGAKAPPPEGWTGRDAPWPSAADVETWCAERIGANLALRAPGGVLGLDVDAYEGKTGAATLAQAHSDLGGLPATWTSSRRFDTDPVSGIRWFRVPEDSRWRPVLGPHVEVVQHGHRYGVAWPSLVEGRRYRWRDPNGELVEAVVPKVDELPALPDSWQERLQRVDAEPVRGAQDARDVFRAFRPGPACRPVTAAVEALSTALDGRASRHDAAVAGVHALACYGREGHRGVPEALRAARTAFLTALGPDRGQAEATAEWSRLAAGALQLAAGRVPVQAQRCSCEAVALDVALPAAEAGSYLDMLVADELQRLRVRRTARQLLAAEDAGALPPVDADTLTAVLARPDEVRWRCERLHPAGGRLLVAAQRKTGKTTFGLNYARSLLTGAPLLGTFPVIPVSGRVVFLNYEVTARQLASWASDVGVPGDRMVLVNLRGRRNLLADDAGRAELVDLLRVHDGEVLMVDPFGRAFTGRSQNDAAEVTPWLVMLDRIAAEAGVSELALTAHAGWNHDHTRGSSALEDWPDAIVWLTRDPDTDQRFLRAEGRDVQVEEDQLAYDSVTRHLRLTGAGSRQDAREAAHLDALVDGIVELVQAYPVGLNVSQLREQLRDAGHSFQREDVGHAAKQAASRGLIRQAPGPRNSTLNLPPEASRPESSRPFPGKGSESSRPVLKGRDYSRDDSPPESSRTGSGS
jgi:hypothetical protein